jgi:hypothetical protein
MLYPEWVKLTKCREEGWEMVSAVPSPGDALIIFLERLMEGQ